MRKRKLVVALTGIRSEYDIFFSPLKAIHEHPDLELRLIVAGAHLASRYGMTVRQIEEDGFSKKVKNFSLLENIDLLNTFLAYQSKSNFLNPKSWFSIVLKTFACCVLGTL